MNTMPVPGIPGTDRTTIVQAEATLLGTAMAYPAAATEVLGDITSGDLVDPVHRVIHTAIGALLAQGTAPEPVLVAAAYTRHAPGPLPPGGIAARIHDCLRAATAPAIAPAYRRALIEARWRRDALVAADRITQAAREWPLTDLHHVLAAELTALGRTLARLTPAPTPAAPARVPVLRDVA